jgi:hypothetical protein
MQLKTFVSKLKSHISNLNPCWQDDQIIVNCFGVPLTTVYRDSSDFMRRFLFLLAFVLLPLSAIAQFGYQSLQDDEYYLRLLQISRLTDYDSSFLLRPVSASGFETDAHPRSKQISGSTSPLFSPAKGVEASLYEPVLFQSYNTRLPRGTNDGRIWQGRGYNTAFTAGGEFSAGILTIRLNPVIGLAQNRAFDLGPYPPPLIRDSSIDFLAQANIYAYRDFLGNVDYVQRYGDSTYSWADLGDSFIELKVSAFRLAFSNQRIWAGPAVNNALQFGYSAPGFRHVYLGTHRPLHTPIGSFEFANIFGKTLESDYFTINRVIKSHSIHSLIAVYTPWFSDHFSLGATRTYFFQFPDSFSEYRSQAKRLFEAGLRSKLKNEDGSERGADPDNQIGSVFFRFVVPERGFEFYFDYGRNDHNNDLRDLRAQPDHHRGYTVGAIKTMLLENRDLFALSLELNQFEANRTALSRGGSYLGGWYTHNYQALGYTNDGQIMGTGYGPGLNMQMAKADLFREKRSYSFKLARIVYHNSRTDQFFDQIQLANEESVERWEVRNIEFMAGGEVTAVLNNGLEVTAGMELSYIMNHHNLSGNDLFNSRFELVLRKQIPGWKR